jgi:hypothetical protein
MQPHTATVFGNLGIDMATGASDPANDAVFVAQ